MWLPQLDKAVNMVVQQMGTVGCAAPTHGGANSDACIYNRTDLLGSIQADSPGSQPDRKYNHDVCTAQSNQEYTMPHQVSSIAVAAYTQCRAMNDPYKVAGTVVQRVQDFLKGSPASKELLLSCSADGTITVRCRGGIYMGSQVQEMVWVDGAEWDPENIYGLVGVLCPPPGSFTKNPKMALNLPLSGGRASAKAICEYCGQHGHKGPECRETVFERDGVRRASWWHLYKLGLCDASGDTCS